MSQHESFVSVIIPTYNARSFLAGAIANVLEQDYSPLEIIVVDDGSTDGTGELATGFPAQVRYLFQPNQGPAAARNRGIRAAAGNVIAFLDADDRWPQNTLRRHTACLAAHRSIQIVQGLIQDLKAEPSVSGNEANFQTLGKPYTSVNLGASLFRATLFHSVGWFDESLRLQEDTDWFFRAWELNIPKLVIDEVSLYYRKHGGNMTDGVDLHLARFPLLFQKHLQRCLASGHNPALWTIGRPGVTEYFGWSETSRRKEHHS